MPPQVTPETLRKRADALEREAAIQAAELRAMANDLEAALRRARKHLDSTSATNHATIPRMDASQESLQSSRSRKRRGPKSTGPVTEIATELGFASMNDLATAIGENPANLRSQNKRRSISARVEAKISDLRAQQAKKQR